MISAKDATFNQDSHSNELSSINKNTDTPIIIANAAPELSAKQICIVFISGINVDGAIRHRVWNCHVDGRNVNFTVTRDGGGGVVRNLLVSWITLPDTK